MEKEFSDMQYSKWIKSMIHETLNSVQRLDDSWERSQGLKTQLGFAQSVISDVNAERERELSLTAAVLHPTKLKDRDS